MKLKMLLLIIALTFSIAGWADMKRWTESGNGVLTDTFTGLQWTQRDNLSDIDWKGAKRYCGTLSLAGGKWQLPSVDELAAIYSGGKDGTTQCGDVTCKVSSLFYLSEHYFWSSTQADNEKVWYVEFNDGERLQTHAADSHFDRALCVRQP